MAAPLACPPHLYLHYIGAVAGVFVGVRGYRGRGSKGESKGLGARRGWGSSDWGGSAPTPTSYPHGTSLKVKCKSTPPAQG